jgi:hypothetical protein
MFGLVAFPMAIGVLMPFQTMEAPFFTLMVLVFFSKVEETFLSAMGRVL